MCTQGLGTEVPSGVQRRDRVGSDRLCPQKHDIRRIHVLQLTKMNAFTKHYNRSLFKQHTSCRLTCIWPALYTEFMAATNTPLQKSSSNSCTSQDLPSLRYSGHFITRGYVSGRHGRTWAAIVQQRANGGRRKGGVGMRVKATIARLWL